MKAYELTSVLSINMILDIYLYNVCEHIHMFPLPMGLSLIQCSEMLLTGTLIKEMGERHVSQKITNLVGNLILIKLFRHSLLTM